nr:leucine zipper domain-containing protein [Actinacidiphila oryziradicis]
MAGHPNAPLTPEGRLRLCLRIDAGRPITHVAVEAGTSRRCLPKWYARWRAHGEGGRRNGESGLASFTVAEVRRLLRTLPCAEPVSLAHATSGPRPPLPLPTPNCRTRRRNHRSMTVRQPSRLQIRLLTCVNGETLVY